MKDEGEGVRYCCTGCKQCITVFVAAQVRCTVCGKAMRVAKEKAE